MALLTWDSRIQTHVDKIDSQHKELVRMVNELYDAMGEGKGKDKITGTVHFLADYTSKHFAMEESLMQQHAYPEYNSHKKLHDALIDQVSKLLDKIDKNESLLTIDVADFLSDWVKNHIIQNDIKLGAYLQTKGLK